MMRCELQGQPEPDKLIDPITWHQWCEANQCPDCRGSGFYLPQSDDLIELLKGWNECYGCEGRGVRPELFDPEF